MTLIADHPPAIVDASVAVASATGHRAAVDALERWADSGRILLAPAVFWVEVANVLVRRHRGRPNEAAGDLQALRAAGIEPADRGFDGLQAAIVLADRHRLSVYDATYLWLAMDVDGELATYDQALANAARAEGVKLAVKP